MRALLLAGMPLMRHSWFYLIGILLIFYAYLAGIIYEETEFFRETDPKLKAWHLKIISNFFIEKEGLLEGNQDGMINRDERNDAEGIDVEGIDVEGNEKAGTVDNDDENAVSHYIFAYTDTDTSNFDITSNVNEENKDTKDTTNDSTKDTKDTKDTNSMSIPHVSPSFRYIISGRFPTMMMKTMKTFPDTTKNSSRLVKLFEDHKKLKESDKTSNLKEKQAYVNNSLNDPSANRAKFENFILPNFILPGSILFINDKDFWGSIIIKTK